MLKKKKPKAKTTSKKLHRTKVPKKSLATIKKQLVDIFAQEILAEVNREVIRAIYTESQFLESPEYKKFKAEVWEAQNNGVIKVHENRDKSKGTLELLQPSNPYLRLDAANKLREYLERAHPGFCFHIHETTWKNGVEIDYSWNHEIKPD